MTADLPHPILDEIVGHLRQRVDGERIVENWVLLPVEAEPFAERIRALRDPGERVHVARSLATLSAWIRGEGWPASARKIDALGSILRREYAAACLNFGSSTSESASRQWAKFCG